MFKKVIEFFRVLGELRYLIPVMRYKFPDPEDPGSLAHTFQATTEQILSEDLFYILKMKCGHTIIQTKQLIAWQGTSFQPG